MSLIVFKLESSTMPNRLREIILMAIFTALAIAGGLFLAQLPNIELVTAMIFLGGMTLGVVRGAIVGTVAEFLYSFFNPYGIASPPLMSAQVISMALAGVAGGLMRHWFGARVPPAWLLGLCGFVITFIFDLLTTLSFTVFTGSGLPGFIAAIVLGLYFYLVHQVSNTLVFALLLPVLLRRLPQLPILNGNHSAAQTLPPLDLQPSINFQPKESREHVWPS